MAKEYYILIKNTDIRLRVSQRTYYIVMNNEVGEIKPNGYEVNIESLKKYKRLYNRARSA